MEDKIRHLEMIQNIIQRMAGNSFFLKGWTLSLIAAMFVLSDREVNQLFFLFTYVPVLMFWFLDSYYLQLERKYIIFFDEIRKKEEIDFDLNVENLNYKNKKAQYIYCLFSKSEILFYMPICLVITLIFKNDIVNTLKLLGK